MATNKRVYYPIHAVGFAPLGTPLPGTDTPSGTYYGAKGVQSAGFTTNFALEQVFELGQLDLYENIENIPNIEVTIQKVIDGYALLEHLATPTATSPTLAGRYNDNQCMLAISYYNINQEFASGVPLSTVVMSGMYVSAINWSIPVQGNMTESVTLVGNDKVWQFNPSGSEFTAATRFTGAESPSPIFAGHVQRRQHVTMGTPPVNPSGTPVSYWPTEIPGISGSSLSGFNPIAANGDLGAHIQNVTIGTNLGRTELFELGRRGPYFRYANFPTEVTCAIEVTANEDGDAVNASSTNATNLVDQQIKIAIGISGIVAGIQQSLIIDLGTKNKLQSIATAGGDTGGGNVTTTYNYSNFNKFKVTHTPSDPAAL